MKNMYDSIKKLMKKHNIANRLALTYSVAWNLTLLFFIIGVVVFCFTLGAGGGYFASLVKDEPIRSYADMEKSIHDFEQTSEVYFADQKYLGKVRTDVDREKADLDQISPHLIHAVISTEDKMFYEHHGVVPKAIVRAMLQEATGSSVQTGGSTLTQQLIKNQFLTNETSFDRKAKEIMLALRLEKYFKKDEILQAYLNVADFGRNSSGRNIAGVQTAAQGLFGVDASKLSIPQAAFIAGLPQSPYGYTPFTNKGEIKEDLSPGLNRMKTVLQRMKDSGFISDKEYQDALRFNLASSLTKSDKSMNENYPFLTNEIESRARNILMDQMAKADEITKEDLAKSDELYNDYYKKADTALRNNGYKIYTTVDQAIYNNMNQIAKDFEYYGTVRTVMKKDLNTGKYVKVKEPVETGAVLIQNKTGRILSFVGGRDYNREQINHATRSVRQNGSSMKPLLDYAPAMEQGIVQPGSVVADVPYSTTGGYTPGNYDGSYHGLVTVRNALQNSYNIPAVKTFMKNQANDPVQYLSKMGFTSLQEEDYTGFPSLSLGGLTTGVSVEENVNAYTTFANGGKFIDAYMIEKIESADGDVIYQHKSKPVDIFTPQTAYLTLDMMRDVISNGTARSMNSYLNFSSDFAGKTGTSNFYHDAWFVASNPSVTFGTWIGYDTPKPLDISYKGINYGNRNVLLWSRLMNGAYKAKPDLVQTNERFKQPNGLVRKSYCTLTGKLPSSLCQKAGLVSTDLFNSKYAPNQVDDSLTEGKFVYMDGKAYKVPKNAPGEFVKTGYLLKENALDSMGIHSLKELKRFSGEKFSSIFISANRELKDDGGNPATIPHVSWNNQQITWSKSASNDVIGYRVYRVAENGAKQLVAKPSAQDTLSAKASDGQFVVVAVDVAGKESAPSQLVGQKKEEKKNDNEKKEKEKPKKTGSN
ncbi:transglycosylase domain-containing protein [Bacillus gobiensis]|uniref:transglycosylase domain-containing protein n=1 Tax=Bacillus gobiensis TaxID=1441095 RepID=UPI003D249C96